MVVIDQLAEFTSIRATEIFFEPLQFHLELADLLEQLSFLGLALLLGRALLASRKQFTGTIQQLPLPLAHLDRMDGVVGGISWIVLRPLIASMATLALNSGLWVRRLLIGGSTFQGWYPASEVNDRGCPEKPDHLTLLSWL